MKISMPTVAMRRTRVAVVTLARRQPPLVKRKRGKEDS